MIDAKTPLSVKPGSGGSPEGKLRVGSPRNYHLSSVPQKKSVPNKFNQFVKIQVMLILNRFWRQGATLFGHTPLTSTSTSGSGTARLPREEEEETAIAGGTNARQRAFGVVQSKSK